MAVYQYSDNLNGLTMLQYIPYAGFKWEDPTLDGLETMIDPSDRLMRLTYNTLNIYRNNTTIFHFYYKIKFLLVLKLKKKLITTFEEKKNYN